jgi:hypothetical protein
MNKILSLLIREYEFIYLGSVYEGLFQLYPASFISPGYNH